MTSKHTMTEAARWQPHHAALASIRAAITKGDAEIRALRRTLTPLRRLVGPGASAAAVGLAEAAVRSARARPPPPSRPPREPWRLRQLAASFQ